MQWAWRPSADRDTITDAPSSTASARCQAPGGISGRCEGPRPSAHLGYFRALASVGQARGGMQTARFDTAPSGRGISRKPGSGRSSSSRQGCLLALSAVLIGAALWLVARRRADPGARPDPACADGHREAGTPRQGPQRWAGCQPAWRATVTPSGDWKWQITEGRRLGYKKPIEARHVQARDHQLLRKMEAEAGLRRGQLPG